MTRKVAVVGSTGFPLTVAVGTQVVDALRELGPDTLILTRGSGSFEQFVATAALTLGLRVFTYKGKGGRDNMDRDDELVRDCTDVLAFVDPATLHDIKTGTARFVGRAVDAKKPIRAATVVEDTLTWVTAEPL